MTNYSKGARFENEVVNTLTDEGYIAQRSAGSHSPWDVVGVNFNEVRFVQCKTCKKDGAKVLEKELFKARMLNKFFPDSCKFEIWVKEYRRPVLIGVV